MRYTNSAKYQTLSTFLQEFSVQFPLLWALLVTVIIAGGSLVLYAFWELVLRGLFFLFSRRSSRRADRG
jgi:NADH:ubiquinone oxidoreductase subunit 4 (subunit M)